MDFKTYSVQVTFNYKKKQLSKGGMRAKQQALSTQQGTGPVSCMPTRP